MTYCDNASIKLIQSGLESLLCICVQVVCGFIEQKHIIFLKQESEKSHSGPFTATKFAKWS